MEEIIAIGHRTTQRVYQGDRTSLELLAKAYQHLKVCQSEKSALKHGEHSVVKSDTDAQLMQEVQG